MMNTMYDIGEYCLQWWQSWSEKNHINKTIKGLSYSIILRIKTFTCHYVLNVNMHISFYLFARLFESLVITHIRLINVPSVRKSSAQGQDGGRSDSQWVCIRSRSNEEMDPWKRRIKFKVHRCLILEVAMVIERKEMDSKKYCQLIFNQSAKAVL